MEAVRVSTRYDFPNESGETRRELYARLGEMTPLFIVPEVGLYLWNIFIDMNSSISRNHDGYYSLIPPSEYLAYLKLTGLLIYPFEYDILKEMDLAYCNELNLEENKRREQMQEEAKRKA